MGYARNVHGGLVSSLGLGFLIWTLIGTLRKVEDGFNFAWRIDVPRSFARRSANYLTLLVVGPLLLVVVAGFSRLAADSTRLRVITELPLLDRLTDSALRLAPYALACDRHSSAASPRAFCGRPWAPTSANSCCIRRA
jgi:membrane protein